MFDGQYIDTLFFIGISACTSLSMCSNNFEPHSNSDDRENFYFLITSAITETRINPDGLYLFPYLSGRPFKYLALEAHIEYL